MTYNNVQAKSNPLGRSMTVLDTGDKSHRLLVDESIYVSESRLGPKWLHLEIVKRLAASVTPSGANRPRILDIGCANGALLQVIEQSAPGRFKLFGSDISESLVSLGRTLVPTATFETLDLTVGRSSFDDMDVVVCSGVLSIFDEIEIPLANCLASISRSRGGTLIAVLNVNDEAVDLITRYRIAGAGEPGAWASGWNCWSRTTLEALVSKAAPTAAITFEPWRMPTWLAKTDGDPMRTYSVLVDGVHRMATGSNLFPPQTIMTVVLPSRGSREAPPKAATSLSECDA